MYIYILILTIPVIHICMYIGSRALRFCVPAEEKKDERHTAAIGGAQPHHAPHAAEVVDVLCNSLLRARAMENVCVCVCVCVFNLLRTRAKGSTPEC